MRFGNRVRQFREKQNISQVQLAERANTSQTLISQLENSRELPTEAVAMSIIDALGVDEQKREKLLKDYRSDKKSFAASKAEGDKFGATFSELQKGLTISVAELAVKLQITPAGVYSWLNGSKLPSDKTLNVQIIPVLREAGVSDEDLQRLKFNHLEDRLTQYLSFEYLTPDEQEDLADCLSKCIDSLRLKFKASS